MDNNTGLERFFGRKAAFRNYATGGLWAGFLPKHGVRYDLVDNTPAELAMVLVLQGKGKYCLSDGTSWELSPGTVFCREPGRTHSTLLDPESRWQECFLAVSAETYSFLTGNGIWTVSEPVFTSAVSLDWLERLDRVIGKMNAGAGPRMALCWAEIVSLGAELIMMHDTSVPSDRNVLMRQACDRLGRGFDLPFDMHDLADRCSMSYSLFRKVFRKYTGQSPGQYRIHRRMEKASSMLLSSAAAVKDIAYELGYPDPYSFSEQFKKMMGTSPSAFRQRAGTHGHVPE